MVIDLLTSHASVRKYKNITLRKTKYMSLFVLDSMRRASHFVQAYSVIHVTDQDKREQLAQLSKNPQQILGAGAVLVFCMDFRLKKVRQVYWKKISTFQLLKTYLLAR